MEPVEVLKAAMAAVTEAGIAEPNQPVALAKMIDLIGGSNSSGALPPPRVRDEGAGAVTADVGARTAAIARELEVDPTMVERLFDEHEGQLQFIGSLERLGGSKQTKVEKLAVLLCAARQSGGYDEDGRTSDAVVRDEIERHGLYDVTNYSKHVKPLTRLTNVNGSGKSATYKMKYEGRVEARLIAKSLLSD